MKDHLDLIRITRETKELIKFIASVENLKQVTVLEYLIKGKLKYKTYDKIRRTTKGV